MNLPGTVAEEFEMNTMDASERSANGGASRPGARRHAVPRQEDARAAERGASSVSDDLGEVLESLSRLVALQFEQAHLSARQSLRRLLAFGLVCVAAAAAAVWCVVSFAQGVAGGLSSWTGRPWLGQLLAGLLGLAALTLAWRLRIRLLDARLLRRLERKFGTTNEAARPRPRSDLRAEPQPGSPPDPQP